MVETLNDTMSGMVTYVENNETEKNAFCRCGAVFMVDYGGLTEGGFDLMMKINDTKSNKCDIADYGAWVRNSGRHRDSSFITDGVKLLVDETRYNRICGKYQ